MDNLTTDFLSFFVPYAISVLVVSLPLALITARDSIIWLRDYYRKREVRLMDELGKEISARLEAERGRDLLLMTKTAKIERLTKKVAALEWELSALRANPSKHNEL